MTTYKDLSIFWVVGSFLWACLSFGLEFSIDKSTIEVGEPAILSVRLPKTSASEKPEVFEDFLTQHKDLKLLEQHAKHDENSYEWTFELTAHKPGSYQIPPIQIQAGPNSYSTTAIPLAVTTTRAVEDTEIRPEQGALSLPFPWRKLFNTSIAIICSLVFLWLLNRIFRRVSWARVKNFRFHFRFPNLETNRMWLRKEIKKIRQDLVSGNASPALVDQTVYVLRMFLLKQTRFPTTAWTSKEITHNLPPAFLRTDLKTIFLHSDHLQFAEPNKLNAKEVAEELLNRIEKEFLQ